MEYKLTYNHPYSGIMFIQSGTLPSLPDVFYSVSNKIRNDDFEQIEQYQLHVAGTIFIAFWKDDKKREMQFTSRLFY